MNVQQYLVSELAQLVSERAYQSLHSQNALRTQGAVEAAVQHQVSQLVSVLERLLDQEVA